MQKERQEFVTASYASNDDRKTTKTANSYSRSVSLD